MPAPTESLQVIDCRNLQDEGSTSTVTTPTPLGNLTQPQAATAGGSQQVPDVAPGQQQYFNFLQGLSHSTAGLRLLPANQSRCGQNSIIFRDPQGAGFTNNGLGHQPIRRDPFGNAFITPYCVGREVSTGAMPVGEELQPEYAEGSAETPVTVADIKKEVPDITTMVKVEPAEKQGTGKLEASSSAGQDGLSKQVGDESNVNNPVDTLHGKARGLLLPRGKNLQVVSVAECRGTDTDEIIFVDACHGPKILDNVDLTGIDNEDEKDEREKKPEDARKVKSPTKSNPPANCESPRNVEAVEACVKREPGMNYEEMDFDHIEDPPYAGFKYGDDGYICVCGRCAYYDALEKAAIMRKKLKRCDNGK